MPTANKYPVPFRTFLLCASEAIVQTNHLKSASSLLQPLTYMSSAWWRRVGLWFISPIGNKSSAVSTLSLKTHTYKEKRLWISTAPQARAQTVLTYNKPTVLFTGTSGSITFLLRLKCVCECYSCICRIDYCNSLHLWRTRADLQPFAAIYWQPVK